MNVKKVNGILGYAFFIVGILKILLVILVLLQFSSGLTAMFYGGSVSFANYTTFSQMIGLMQILLAIASIIMIILNAKNQPKVIPGYLWGLGAVLIEYITPSMLYFYVVFAECGMYMKAGIKIRNKNLNYKDFSTNNQKLAKNTEWFFSDENQQIDIKEEKRKAKVEEELYEWKKLLDSGEIDEETYNEETNKLIEREKRRSARKKKN